ncbi:MAG: hypothetical protein ACKO27_12085 [Ilumatobacteraceae bacterium]
MTMSYDTSREAIAAWGKFSHFPERELAAEQAVRVMSARHGEPSARGAHAQRPFRNIASRTYVAVQWEGVNRLYIHAGFIDARDDLGDGWIERDLEDGDEFETGTRVWRLAFPGHQSNERGIAKGLTKAACACNPGLLVTVGTACGNCDNIAVAVER